MHVVLNRQPIRRSCLVRAEGPLPKTGTVGEERFKELKVPGTYWWKQVNFDGQPLTVRYETDDGIIETKAQSGDNVLRVAEACGAVVINEDFCLEGTCELCMVECSKLKETSYKAESLGDGVVRACLTPFPKGETEVDIKILNDEGIWNEGVV